MLNSRNNSLEPPKGMRTLNRYITHKHDYGGVLNLNDYSLQLKVKYKYVRSILLLENKRYTGEIKRDI